MNNEKEKHYYLHKNNVNKEIVYIEYSNLSGYSITPKKNNVNHITVEKMIIISPLFVTKFLKKKITKKLEILIEKLKKIMLEDDEGNSDVSLLLDECEKLKAYTVNNLKKLDVPFVNIIFNKVDLIYEQVKKYQTKLLDNYSTGKSR